MTVADGRRQAVAPKWGVTREQHGRHLGRCPLMAGSSRWPPSILQSASLMGLCPGSASSSHCDLVGARPLSRVEATPHLHDSCTVITIVSLEIVHAACSHRAFSSRRVVGHRLGKIPTCWTRCRCAGGTQHVALQFRGGGAAGAGRRGDRVPAVSLEAELELVDATGVLGM